MSNDYGYDQHYLTPQPRARKSMGRRLSLGAKKGFKTPLSPPSSPLSHSKQSMTRVDMLGDMAGDITPTPSPVYEEDHQVPQTTGGHRRKLKIGGLRNTLHGIARHDHGDDGSVLSANRSAGRPDYKRGMSFTPKALKKKLGKGLMSRVKSDRHIIRDPAELEFLNDSDHSQASHYKGSKTGSAHTGDDTVSVGSNRKLSKKLSKKESSMEDDDQSQAGTVVSKSGRRHKKKKNIVEDDDDQSQAGTVTSKSGKRRKKKKNTTVEDSPGSVASKKKLRKGRRAATGDDVSVSSKSKRRSRKPKTKVNAWGEEVEEVSEDDTFVHSLYGDDASISKRRRRRRKKKKSLEDDEAKKSVEMRSNHSKDSEEVEKRRLALEQELDAMLDLSNHKLDGLDNSTKPPPPPPLNNSPDDFLMPVPPVNPNSKRRSQSGFTSYENLRSPNTVTSDLKSPVNTYAPRKDQYSGSLNGGEGEDDDDDDDIQSVEENDDRPPIESLTFSQRGRRTIPVEQDITEHTNTYDAASRTYEYALGDTTSDEEGVGPLSVTSSKRRNLRGAKDGGESVSSKKSASISRSPRVGAKKPISDDMSTGGMSASSLKRKHAKKEKNALNKKMDSMLDQLQKYESNLEEEQKKLQKKLENMTIEKEYLAQRNRQLEFKLEELKDKAAEDADQLLHATRNKTQSSEEIEDLRIQNEILKEKLQRHEDSMLRMNAGRSVRGIRSIIKGVEDPDKYEKELSEKDKEISKLKADLALMRDQLRYKSEDYDKQAVELHQARKEVTEARTTLKHTGTFKYHNRYEEIKNEKVKNKSQQEAALLSFFDD